LGSVGDHKDGRDCQYDKPHITFSSWSAAASHFSVLHSKPEAQREDVKQNEKSSSRWQMLLLNLTENEDWMKGDQDVFIDFYSAKLGSWTKGYIQGVGNKKFAGLLKVAFDGPSTRHHVKLPVSSKLLAPLGSRTGIEEMDLPNLSIHKISGPIYGTTKSEFAGSWPCDHCLKRLDHELPVEDPNVKANWNVAANLTEKVQEIVTIPYYTDSESAKFCEKCVQIESTKMKYEESDNSYYNLSSESSSVGSSTHDSTYSAKSDAMMPI